VIYLDTSVVLGHLLAEDRRPPDTLWSQPMVSSRLLEYEVWTRLHARNLATSHGEAARALLARLAFLELATPVLARALEPWPLPLRTLDAMHLSPQQGSTRPPGELRRATGRRRQGARLRAGGYRRLRRGSAEREPAGALLVDPRQRADFERRAGQHRPTRMWSHRNVARLPVELMVIALRHSALADLSRHLHGPRDSRVGELAGPRRHVVSR
jgi:hypothetical protein